MWPVVGRIWPVMSFIRVDLPDPFVPITPTDSPRPTTNDSGCSAWTSVVRTPRAARTRPRRPRRGWTASAERTR